MIILPAAIAVETSELPLPRALPPPPPASDASACKDSRTGVLVRRRNRPVDVDENPRVRRRVGSRKGDLVGRIGAAPAGDADLRTRDVELGAPGGRGTVQGDVLGSEEIGSRLDAARDRDGERGLA